MKRPEGWEDITEVTIRGSGKKWFTVKKVHEEGTQVIVEGRNRWIRWGKLTKAKKV